MFWDILLKKKKDQMAVAAWFAPGTYAPFYSSSYFWGVNTMIFYYDSVV
jgi:hypothetical protein